MSKTKETASPPIAPAAPAAPDPNAGRGGAYELVDGVRVLVERTKDRSDTPVTKPL